MNSQFLISVVIPAYNEEGNIDVIFERIGNVLQKTFRYEVIFVDDGSTDHTLDNIKKLQSENLSLHYLSLSRNFGHQVALKAGIDFANGDCVICMDADLQHPPELMIELINKWQEGYDIVYTLRKQDERLPFIKRKASSFFYKLINSLSDISLQEGAADYRLIDKRVAQIIAESKEDNLFLRGYISWIGFKQYAVSYRPGTRYSGETKYSLKKMLLFALNGITSFSIRPLRLATIFGCLLSVLSFVYGIYAIYLHFFTNRAVTGWVSVIVSVLFIGGIQLLILGIIGEYVGRMYMQTKQRPPYIVKETDVK
jgi:polyisoprenyl-phosphate glycosyltransferase